MCFMRDQLETVENLKKPLSSFPGTNRRKERTGNLSIGKLSYRIPFPYGCILFPEQFTMRPGEGRRQHQHVVLNAVGQQP